jgi:hypothetical protein
MLPTIATGNVASAIGSGYEVANSCRFDTAGTTYMTKAAFSNTGTNAFKFTFSCWIKRANLGVNQRILTAGDSTRDGFTFNSSDQLQFFAGSNSSEVNPFVTNRRFRDVSAWYNIVIACDSELTGATNQTKLYVNGTLETSFSATAAVDDENTWHIGNAKIHRIGTDSDSSLDYYLDGYLAEVVLIDGQQLTASSFGEFDSDSPTIWKPKDVSGLTFGTNGFYLDFEDSGDLGDDESGNTHDFTETNLAATDQATDTPTNNFATYNPLLNTQNVPTFAEGNTQAATTGSGVNGGFSSIGVSSAKWYAEFKLSAHSGTNRCILGVTSDPAEDNRNNEYFGQTARSYSYSAELGRKYNNNSASSYGDSYTTNDILGVALDLDNLKIYFSKNGTWQDSGDPESGATGTGAAFTVTAPASTASGNYFFGAGDESGSHSCTVQANFGNPTFAISSGNADANGYGNFEYAVPSGYLAVCTKNLGSDGG